MNYDTFNRPKPAVPTFFWSVALIRYHDLFICGLVYDEVNTFKHTEEVKYNPLVLI